MKMTVTERGARHWAVIVSALAIFLAVVATISLTVEAAEDETLEGDVAVATTVQRVSVPGVRELVVTMNWAGQALPMTALTLLVATGLATQRRWPEMLVVAPIVLTHPVNWAIKQMAESPRPTTEYVRVTDPSGGFGFPSGHTMGVFIFCGVIAYLATTQLQNRLMRYAIQGGAAAAALAVGFSRIYSGAHWPSDVLGAYLWGAFYIGLLVVLHRALSRRMVPLQAV
jgi:undecaprenyl-diphosphatase